MTSNVVNLFDKERDTRYNALYPNSSELYFYAVERDNYWHGKDGNFRAIPGEKSIIRADKGSDGPFHLATVGQGYKVVQNRSLFNAIAEQFEQALSPEEVEGVKIHDSMSYHGRTCLREYQFPNARITGDTGRSEIAFRTIIVNGFGGSSVKLFSGAIDFFCTNGMIGGQFDAGYHRHTKNLQISHIVEKIRRSVDVFYKQADIWRKWMGKTISKDDAEQFLKEIVSERLAAKLLRQYLIEAESHGFTVWALYSAMTYYATHNEGEFEVRKTDNDHTATTLLKRETDVADWTQTDAFKQLAEAA